MSSGRHLVILGGGCAGLSLGVRLAASPPADLSVTIIEPRAAYTADRTWGFWDTDPHPFRALISHRWAHWHVSHGEAVVRCGDPATPYACLPAARFYSHAVEQILASPNVLLHQNRAAAAIAPSGGGWRVALSDGTTLTADYLLDTRPPATLQPKLVQAFVGLEVVAATPLFDPQSVGLMEYTDEVAGIPCFLYTLPFTETHALVEATVFTPRQVSLEALEAVVRRHLPTGIDVVRREVGALPMGLMASAAKAPWPQAGMAGGAVRPATGYAFLRIQRWAQACAARLEAGGAPIGQGRDPWADRWMDGVLLRVLGRRPEMAPEIFTRLFQRVAAERLVRFLSDRSRLMDRVQLMSSLPVRPFLAAAFAPHPRYQPA